MAAQGFLLIAGFLLVLLVLARPLGMWLARMINGLPLPGVQALDAGLLRMLGIRTGEMDWRHYLLAILLLNGVGLAVLFATGLSAAQSSAASGPLLASGAEHCGQLCQ